MWLKLHVGGTNDLKLNLGIHLVNMATGSCI